MGMRMKGFALFISVAWIALAAATPVFAQNPEKPGGGPGASPSSQRTKNVHVEAIAPRPEDVGSLNGIMKAFYEVISGPAGAPREWSRDRTLYIPGVHFVSMSVDAQGVPVAHVVDHQQFVDASSAVLVEKGFYEQEIHRETKRFGNIAHIFSTYESRLKENGPIIERGVNSIELFWDGKRWWITGAIWDNERKDNPMPKDLLN